MSETKTKTTSRSKPTTCDCKKSENGVSGNQTTKNGCSCQEKRERLTKEINECEATKITEEELREVYKNACTGKESVEILKAFSSDKGFRNLLIRQYNEYSSLANDIELYADKLGYRLEKTSVFAKGMMYFTTAVNTMKDKSDSKLSEIMMQGINMGIVAMTKLTNKLSCENRSCDLANNLLDLLKKDLEEMKMFL